MYAQPQPVTITRKKIKSLVNDTVKSAEAVNLLYMTDRQAGISRIRKGKGFTYRFNGRQVTDKSILSRIKSLVIPPAWRNVWVCPFPNGHIQATGIDANGRKQYRYHVLWNALRKETKFFHLHDFGNALPDIRKQVNADLALPGLPRQKVLAVIVALMEYTGVRIGSNCYEKLYGSYGITTLKDEHVQIAGNELKFSFRGKKRVFQNFTLKSKKLARIIRQCKDVAGQELFQYYDENGIRRPVDSGMVNAYIKNICGKSFTSKDFRTWHGTLTALEAFCQLGCCENISESKKKIVEAMDIVAGRLGNTRAVCRQYYVHPIVIQHYVDNNIHKFIEQVPPGNGNFSREEQVLMNMLSKVDNAVIAA
jgi:DNA topoisomerase I